MWLRESAYCCTMCVSKLAFNTVSIISYGKVWVKAKSPIVKSALSQLCDPRARCSTPFAGPEPAVSCKHSSVIWMVSHTSPIYCRYLPSG